MAGDGIFKWWWQTGTDENPESYHGPCETKDQAIAEARSDDGLKYGFVIVEADRAVPSVDIFDSSYILERYEEHNEECWGEDGADVRCTNAQERDLEAKLAAALDAWFKEHGISQHGWAFNDMRNSEVFQPEKQEVS